MAEATAEVYCVDMIAQGIKSGDVKTYERLLSDLKVTTQVFEDVAAQLTNPGIKLREIKDRLDLRYNQIRAVMAVLIHGYYHE